MKIQKKENGLKGFLFKRQISSIQYVNSLYLVLYKCPFFTASEAPSCYKDLQKCFVGVFDMLFIYRGKRKHF